MSTTFYELPTLFKKTSTGAIQKWTIGVLDSTIITVYGQVDGKEQRTEDVIREGKNIGKTNETTPHEQALSEAHSKWEKQVKKGYVPDIDRARDGETDVEGGYGAMLAHKFSEQGHKIKYPVFVQPKLDGIRCLAIIDEGVCTLWSRTRKPILSMPHIVKELEDVYSTGYHRIDGELYNHSYKANFEHIVSLVRQEEPDPNHTDVEYHVYDKAMDDGRGFAGRFEDLRLDLHCYEKAKALLKHIVLVETCLAKDEDDMLDMFQHFRSKGYEGAMARNAEGAYMGKRSYDLQKIKEFDDAEFPIIGVEEGRGKLQGHAAAFICVTPTGERFKAKMRGDTSLLKAYFEDHSLWSNKILTVKYQGLTGKNGVPRFPVGERFRDDL